MYLNFQGHMAKNLPHFTGFFSFRQRAFCQNFLTSLEDFSIKFYSIDLNMHKFVFSFVKPLQAFSFKWNLFVVIDTFLVIQSNHAYRNFFNTGYFSDSIKNVIMLGLYFDGLVRFYLVILFLQNWLSVSIFILLMSWSMALGCFLAVVFGKR